MDTTDRIRDYWDADAATYDQGGDHTVRSAAERAAWLAVLHRVLPPAPARVLDAGAGTGFLSLLAAELGHDVTALDLSGAMLDKLAQHAEAGGLSVTRVHAAAAEPPDGPFDAVMARHLLWTLPHPSAELRAWRAAAPSGRLVVVEGLWGQVDPVAAGQQQLRRLLRRVQGCPPAHHREYDRELLDRLPFGRGTTPGQVVEAVTAAGWSAPRLERLRDVEWARRLALPLPERAAGVTPQYVVVAA